MVLDRITRPNDIKKLSREEILELSSEIRNFLLESISKNGGHLASNLGVVELTIALHLCLDLYKDTLVWDVGHQCYTHKILTGRKDGFDKLRKFKGLSGFPDPSESSCDPFIAGHSSTAVSLGLGFAQAAGLKGSDEKIVSVIGDGALTGGLAYEALNNASNLNRNFLIILNDNQLSISENVGGMSKHLAGLRTSSGYQGLKAGVHSSLEKIPGGDKLAKSIHKTKSGIKHLMIHGMVFEDMDIMYLGPVYGHDIFALKSMIEKAFLYDGPVVLHVITEKGRGYEPAIRHPARFHGTGPFEKETGLPLGAKISSYTDVFSTVMRKLGDRNEKIIGITAAMKDGVGLKRFANMFPDRFFDVGIAEGHAVTFAAALAKRGLIPVVAVYSSFLQRAYDEIVHDVGISHAHVIFAIDRAGLVGEDGRTHHGIFDLSYMSTIPDMVICAPKNKWELSDMIKFAVSYDGPIAIRYPRGAACDMFKEKRAAVELGRSEVISESEKHEDNCRVLIFALGEMVKTAVDIPGKVGQKADVDVVNARFAQPLDREFLDKAAGEYDLIVTLEDNVRSGGFGEHVTAYMSDIGYKGHVLNIAIPDTYVEHGSVGELMHELGMDADSVANRITDWVYKE
ncbi:MAG: 1-deoxy-D-xylulose-5-phosphate synthase [Lachnospiraceae bacterium]|nr:1-deoxy-D-xylulose-5-phosphate synthase [Lachnospiraceae bacterium]